MKKGKGKVSGRVEDIAIASQIKSYSQEKSTRMKVQRDYERKIAAEAYVSLNGSS